MIAKQIKGCDFKGCLDYLLNKEASKIIGGNMVGLEAESLTEEFNRCKPISGKAKRKVYHASLSLSASEKISEDKWKAIALDYLEGMGFTDNQHVIVAHSDTEHNHIHIVANRTKRNGRIVDDGWDFVKSEKLVRELEQKYDLTITPGSKERLQRSPTTGESRLRRRTGESSVREYLQGAIDSVCSQKQTMPEFIDKLENMGIETRITFKDDFKGISFKAMEIAFSGTHLGKGYTFPGLQKYKGVDYIAERDDRLLLRNQPDNLPPVSNSLLKTIELIENYRAMMKLEENKKKHQQIEI